MTFYTQHKLDELCHERMNMNLYRVKGLDMQG